MKKPEPPCLQCAERRPGCHNPETCAPWGAFEAAKAAFEADRLPHFLEVDETANYVRRKRLSAERRRRNFRK